MPGSHTVCIPRKLFSRDKVSNKWATDLRQGHGQDVSQTMTRRGWPKPDVELCSGTALTKGYIMCDQPFDPQPTVFVLFHSDSIRVEGNQKTIPQE